MRGGMGNAPRGGTGHVDSYRVLLLIQPSRGSPSHGVLGLEGLPRALGLPLQGPSAHLGHSWAGSPLWGWGGVLVGSLLVQLRFSA